MEEKKRSRIYSIFKNKCPICHQGDVFLSKKVFSPTKFSKMHERCTHCSHKYEKEPAYFFGAMYVGYAISVAFSVAIFCSTYSLFPSTPYWMYIVLILIGLVVLAPITYRGGRLIWLNIFDGYKSKNERNE